MGSLFAGIAALGNILGGMLVVFSARRNRAVLGALVGFGAGFMLGVVALDMLPAVMTRPGQGGVFAVLVGYLGVHLTQHILTPHFHFGEEIHAHAMVSRGVGVWALVGLLPHSFFDGVAISSGFRDERQLGILIFSAVLLHKIPAGVSLASVMLASGNERRAALGAVVLIAAATVVGALVTAALAPLASYGLALATGVTIYVAASNLIPESQRERSWLVQGAVFLGIAVFYVARSLLPGG